MGAPAGFEGWGGEGGVQRICSLGPPTGQGLALSLAASGPGVLSRPRPNRSPGALLGEPRVVMGLEAELWLSPPNAAVAQP